jgi:hypothetical protein
VRECRRRPTPRTTKPGSSSWHTLQRTFATDRVAMSKSTTMVSDRSVDKNAVSGQASLTVIDDNSGIA